MPWHEAFTGDWLAAIYVPRSMNQFIRSWPWLISSKISIHFTKLLEDCTLPMARKPPKHRSHMRDMATTWLRPQTLWHRRCQLMLGTALCAGTLETIMFQWAALACLVQKHTAHCSLSNTCGCHPVCSISDCEIGSHQWSCSPWRPPSWIVANRLSQEHWLLWYPASPRPAKSDGGRVLGMKPVWSKAETWGWCSVRLAMSNFLFATAMASSPDG